jgi:hypothetical protein
MKKIKYEIENNVISANCLTECPYKKNKKVFSTYCCDLCDNFVGVDTKERIVYCMGGKSIKEKYEETLENNKSQKATLLKALKKGQALTHLQIIRRFMILRPSARISELRSMGYNITTDMVTDPKSKKRYGVYKLHE